MKSVVKKTKTGYSLIVLCT